MFSPVIFRCNLMDDFINRDGLMSKLYEAYFRCILKAYSALGENRHGPVVDILVSWVQAIAT